MEVTRDLYNLNLLAELMMILLLGTVQCSQSNRLLYVIPLTGVKAPIATDHFLFAHGPYSHKMDLPASTDICLFVWMHIFLI